MTDSKNRKLRPARSRTLPRSPDESRLQLALEATGVGLWDWDLRTGAAFLSPGYYALTGYRPEDVTPGFEFFRQTVHPDDWPGVQAAMEAHLRNETPDSMIEYRLVTASGALRWIRGRGKVVERDTAGTPLRMVGHITDISKQKQLEEALHGSHVHMRLIQEAAQVGTWEWDVANGKLTWSSELLRMYGYSEANFPGDYAAFASRVHPEDLARAERERDEAVAAGRPFAVDFRVRLPDGQLRWVLSKGAAEYDAAGRPTRVFGINIDITERKRLEELLAVSEARYRMVLEDQTEVIARVRADGTFLFANDAFCRLYGKTAEELIGNVWQPTVLPEDLDLVLSRLSELRPDNPLAMCENRVITGNGRIRWLQYANRGFFDAEGHLLEIQAVGRDITEQKLIESRKAALLEENSRLTRELIDLQDKERAHLARELHDELSQQLVAIRARAAAIHRRAASGDTRLQADADAIEASASQIYAASHRLMEGLHPQLLDSVALDEALRMLLLDAWLEEHGDIRATLRQAGRLDAIGAEVLIHLFRITQGCLSNVALHARASRVRLFLGERRTAGRRLLRLVVRDDGVGMDPAAGRDGLGLRVMQERARNLGGSFDLQSRPGAGTRVAVEVPLAG